MVGPNGAGKTTTLSMAVGLLQPDGGSARIFGVDVWADPVPICFNLFGVDQQVKVWFAARYLPQRLQVPVAAGFIALGVLLAWLAESLPRRYAARQPPGPPS